MVEGEAVGLLQRYHVRNGLVHDLCALTAESGDDHEAAQAEFLSRFLFGVENELSAHRHPHDLHLFRVPVVADAFLKGHQHPAGLVRRQTGGDAGDGVALVDAGGNAHGLGGVQRREAGIAAGANDHVGLEFPENLLARLHTLPHAFYRVEVLFHCG